MANLGTIGSLMVEIGVEKADTAKGTIDKVGTALKKSGDTAQREVPKMERFLKRYGGALAAVGIAAAAIGTFIKTSPIISGYFEEFGSIVGAIGDTIGTIFEPFIDILLDSLWDLSDWFDSKAPEMAKMFAPLIPVWTVFVDILTATGKTVLPILISGIGSFITFIGKLFTSIQGGDWAGAWQIVKDAALGAWTWISNKMIIALDAAWTFINENLLPSWLSTFLVTMSSWLSGKTSTFALMGKMIVEGMEWYEMGVIAVKRFWQGFKDSFFSEQPDRYDIAADPGRFDPNWDRMAV